LEKIKNENGNTPDASSTPPATPQTSQ